MCYLYPISSQFIIRFLELSKTVQSNLGAIQSFQAISISHKLRVLQAAQKVFVFEMCTLRFSEVQLITFFVPQIKKVKINGFCTGFLVDSLVFENECVRIMGGR